MTHLLSGKKAAVALLFSAGLVLLLWGVAPQWMQAKHPNYTGCNPLSAICFILFGLALLAQLREPGERPFPVAITGLLVCVAVGRLGSGWFGYSFPLDKLIFTDRLHSVQFSMATASCFLLTGSATLWHSIAPRQASRWGLLLLMPAAGIVLFSLLGFMLNEKDVRESLFLSPMSLVTTSLFLLLLVPISWIFRENALLKIFQSPLLGGLMARRLLPWFLLIPIVVFLLGIVGRKTGLFTYALSGSVQISVLFFALLLVLVKLARVIDMLDQKQKAGIELLAANAVILDKANKDLQTFTYAASHDLQEPLRKISVFAGMIRDRPESAATPGYLEKIIGSATRGTQLIHDILEYSRTVDHRESFTDTDLGEILAEVIADFDRSEQSVPPQIDSMPMPGIEATAFQMRQLFSNLLSNSFKFAVKTRPLVISITAGVLPAGEILFPGYDAGKTFWKIVFSDNGEGFEKKHAERIFEVFQRASRNRISGSGIGLSLCKKIVDAHGGHIFAESVPGSGASFTIILPERQTAL